MKCSHNILIALSGAVWFAVGLYLLPLGIHFLLDMPQGPLLAFFVSVGVSSENSGLLLLTLGLAIGFFKSKTVFAKTVDRGVLYIRSLPLKAPIYAVYTPKYLLLLGGMMFLGLSMKWFAVPLDIRGIVDVAVGSALIQGSIRYFRAIIRPKIASD